MSCISQILKKLPDEGCLVIGDKENTDFALEGGGIYKNYEYVIILNGLGHRCGYVAIPPEHPFDKIPKPDNDYCRDGDLDYSEMDIECHGGLTFASRNHGLKSELNITCNDAWIGFDCGHYDDGIDFDAMRKYYGDEYTEKLRSTLYVLCDGTVKDFDYVANECKSIIDQLVEKEAA